MQYTGAPVCAHRQLLMRCDASDVLTHSQWRPPGPAAGSPLQQESRHLAKGGVSCTPGAGTWCALPHANQQDNASPMHPHRFSDSLPRQSVPAWPRHRAEAAAQAFRHAAARGEIGTPIRVAQHVQGFKSCIWAWPSGLHACDRAEAQSTSDDW